MTKYIIIFGRVAGIGTLILQTFSLIGALTEHWGQRNGNGSSKDGNNDK